MSPRLFREILVMFVNKLTANGKYLAEDWENFQLAIEMLLSEKRKPFP